MTKFLNIDLDTKLGGSTPSDVLVSSQKAIKTYVDTKLLEETTRAQDAETGLDTRVSGIEVKIPDSASADNKLATKADLENVGVAIDGTTITKKADGKIQASAVVNQNTGVLKSWTGTLAEYNALETKSDDTLYVITDDDSEGINVYTKSEVDILLDNKQDKLVSGTNIKTVNGETLLGSGNIKIQSGGGGVPVGAIFTTPRTGPIEGAVEANGGSYNIADYSGAGSIGALLTAGSIAYVSKTEFQTQVTNTGACDSFGWNGVSGAEALYAWSPTPEDLPAGNPTIYTKTSNPSVGGIVYYISGDVAGNITAIENNIITVDGDAPGDFGRDTTKDIAGTADATFLVPKLNPWHIGKNASVVGNGMTLGLTDGTNNTGLYYSGNSTMTYRPDVFGKPAGTSDSGSAPTTAVSLGVTTDSTKSGMVADLSETTNLRVMVQLATGATDEALETCTNVLVDVSELKDLSNLTSTGKNIANWSSNVTNCLTEIPQDIKLELNNGTLTLKAGSKVYVPNGAGVFDVVAIANDITMDGGVATGAELVYVTVNANALMHYLDNSSGTDWTATSQYQCRYNTSANMIKNTNNTGSAWGSQLSFPIAKITLSSGTVTSIDQVFNGFGYIGSTIFALPGVKGLIPNGRNPDGTLKSIEFTTNSVQVWINKNYTFNNFNFGVNNSGELTVGLYNYNEEQNIVRDTNGTYCILGTVSATPQQITAFIPKTVFHATDYSEGDYVVFFQAPTATNNYTWYRKYKSGWVEQGGVETLTGVKEKQITFPVIMLDNNYTPSVTAAWSSSAGPQMEGVENLQTTGMRLTTSYEGVTLWWQVCGIAG